MKWVACRVTTAFPVSLEVLLKKILLKTSTVFVDFHNSNPPLHLAELLSKIL